MINSLYIGDTVAIVATAKRLEVPIEDAIKTLESWGLKVKIFDSVNSSSEYFAGNDELRLANLQSALDDNEVKAIIFARGGYGTTRILDQVDFSRFKEYPKWICGFSDLSSLLLQLSKFDIPGIHGPMLYTLNRDEQSSGYLKQMLFGEKSFGIDSSMVRISKQGMVVGKISGGNLSLVYESLGAANEIETSNRILFLEEVGEELYAIDRMMNKLKRTGKLAEISGLILGNFTSVKDKSGYFNKTVQELVLSYFDHLEGPIVTDFPSGHEDRNFPIIFNQSVKLLVGEREISFTYL